MDNRIAVVFEDNIFDRKGAFRAKLERSRYLFEKMPQTDVWCIQTHYTWIERLLLGNRSYNGLSEHDMGCPKVLQIDGVRVNMIWMNYSIVDHFLFFKLKRLPFFYPRFLRKISSFFKDYDVISTHSFEGGFLAREVKKRFGVPYCVTWHGSDIHTKPFKYPCLCQDTAGIMEEARMNFFVSEALLEKSIAVGAGRKMVLYNGANPTFARFSEEKRKILRDAYGVKDKTVVGFVGNLEFVKNAQLLPDIFSCIHNLLGDFIEFWLIGDGRLMSTIRLNMSVRCRFWGNVAPEEMPAIYNSMDLLVLPSKNEGLPLVLLESLSCGCRAVGTKVGGIPEVLGDKYCVSLGENFVQRFSKVAAQTLAMPFSQHLPQGMSWEESVRKEVEVYETILKG